LKEIDMQEQVFEKITPEHFEALSTMVRSETGIEMRGNSGEAGHNGYEMKWNLVGDTLTMQCTKRPWLFPERIVSEGIENLVYMSDPDRAAKLSAEAPQQVQDGTQQAPEGSAAVDTGAQMQGADIQKAAE
jgi:hypothetical protein